jgi:anti-anti-sigma factor
MPARDRRSGPGGIRMPLAIETRMEEEIAIFELAGALTLGPSLVSLRNAARETLAKPSLAGIILDVGQITSVDSSGLGELTIVYSSASRRNCPMLLARTQTNLTKMLEMTHLDGVLISAESVEAAKKKIKSK